jgi:hypothetical protein
VKTEFKNSNQSICKILRSGNRRKNQENRKPLGSL